MPSTNKVKNGSDPVVGNPAASARDGSQKRAEKISSTPNPNVTPEPEVAPQSKTSGRTTGEGASEAKVESQKAPVKKSNSKTEKKLAVKKLKELAAEKAAREKTDKRAKKIATEDAQKKAAKEKARQAKADKMARAKAERAEKSAEKARKQAEKLAKKKTRSKAKVNFESRMPREEAVAYFEALIIGIKKGTVQFKQGKESVAINPSDVIDVNFKARTKGLEQRVTFELSWRAKEDGNFSVTSG